MIRTIITLVIIFVVGLVIMIGARVLFMSSMHKSAEKKEKEGKEKKE
ncbi:MAG: hypothetical protein QMD08_03655 [Actinomycetota bacterium]|nr:hypothetical protein [Actinomycetota bacterium]